MPFVSHSQEKAPYLALNVSFSEVNEIKNKLEQKMGKKLINRGEAHVTVITPPEYELLKEKISMTTIDELASLSKIQEAPFQVVCVGKGSLTSPKLQETYFLVLSAPELISLRKKILQTYITLGGNDQVKFNPEEFYPHITVGFLERDLHIQDGVVKDRSSCYEYLESISN